MDVAAASRWWHREEPDLATGEIARMLGVHYNVVVAALRADRTPLEHERAETVKAAVRSGLSYDQLASQFGWPRERKGGRP